MLSNVPGEARDRFVAMVTGLPGRWISNKGQTVLPHLWTPRDGPDGRFLLAVDGVPRALADSHGASVVGIPQPPRAPVG